VKCASGVRAGLCAASAENCACPLGLAYCHTTRECFKPGVVFFNGYV